MNEIDKISLETRAYNCLFRNGIYESIDDLKGIDIVEIAALRNSGLETFKQIKKFLDDNNIEYTDKLRILEGDLSKNIRRISINHVAYLERKNRLIMNSKQQKEIYQYKDEAIIDLKKEIEILKNEIKELKKLPTT